MKARGGITGIVPMVQSLCQKSTTSRLKRLCCGIGNDDWLSSGLRCKISPEGERVARRDWLASEDDRLAVPETIDGRLLLTGRMRF